MSGKRNLITSQPKRDELAVSDQQSASLRLFNDTADPKKNAIFVPEPGTSNHSTATECSSNSLDAEYAAFMEAMASSGAYDADKVSDSEKPEESSNHDTQQSEKETTEEDNVEDDLAMLLGMKCGVYHTHKWGGQPTLHNAMVCAVMPRQESDQYQDIKVRVLFTHPTHTEMLPCPFFLDGECRFDDEQCRYSHGAIVLLSDLKDAVEPNFDSIKIGSRILLKLKPPDDEDISLTRKSSEKYHLWHRGIVTSVNLEKNTCIVKLEHRVKTGEKRKSASDECHVRFEEIFPLTTEEDDTSDSEDSLSDTEYPDTKATRLESDDHQLLVEKSLQNNAPAMGEWERHTRGIGSKLMLAMGYVPGTGLGATSDGRLQPVEARVLPVGKSLDQCMAISEGAAKDPLKVEQKLRRQQKKEEERNKRAYEREKERERRNVFNFLNNTLGDKAEEPEPSVNQNINLKQSTTKDLNIEQFKITEDTRKLERDIVKLNSSIVRHPLGSPGFRSINMQIVEKNKELSILKRKEQQITKEQAHRKDRQKMTIF